VRRYRNEHFTVENFAKMFNQKYEKSILIDFKPTTITSSLLLESVLKCQSYFWLYINIVLHVTRHACNKAVNVAKYSKSVSKSVRTSLNHSFIDWSKRK